MKHFHIKRMLKLCDFLDELPRTKFDFSIVREERKCGTVGCAMGWTPTVFPRLVKADSYVAGDRRKMDVVMRNGNSLADYIAVAVELFGISEIEASALFSPDEALYSDNAPFKKVLPPLPWTATPKQVSKRLRRFLKWKTKQTQNV